MELQKTHRGFTLYLRRPFSYLLTAYMLQSVTCQSQQIVKEFQKDSLALYLAGSKPAVRKIIPAEYKDAISLALLYYPELQHTCITFKVTKHGSPLAARPRLLSVFRSSSKRKYLVTISNDALPRFESILLKNLAFNSRVGVIGHELSHVSDYGSRRGIYFFKLVLMHLFKRQMDRFEYDTDKRCIEHGLGYQLLSWSTEVRSKLHLMQWKGIKHLSENGRERYMNPESIRNVMDHLKIYNY